MNKNKKKKKKILIQRKSKLLALYLKNLIQNIKKLMKVLNRYRKI